MHFNMMRTFLEAATTRSFVVAAKRLHITQSTVSMRVAALENELGRVLFNRSKAGVSLTRAGGNFSDTRSPWHGFGNKPDTTSACRPAIKACSR
jgi:DNA-binding transcriptional LysR family regulator